MMPLILILVLACSGGQDSGTDSGSLDGTTGAPEGGCVEVSRQVVEDPAVATAPMDFAADEALAAGSFEGSGTLRHADGSDHSVPVQWSVLAGSEVLAVDMELDDSGEGGEDSGPATGAPGADKAGCPDYYQVDATGTLTTTVDSGSGLWLYENWGAPLLLWSAGSASVSFDLDATELGGDFAPDFDPADWDTAVLAVSATTTETGWQGELQWSASKELGDGMGKSVVGPAGSFDVERVD